MLARLAENTTTNCSVLSLNGTFDVQDENVVAPPHFINAQHGSAAKTPLPRDTHSVCRPTVIFLGFLCCGLLLAPYRACMD